MSDRSVFYAFSFHSPYSALADCARAAGLDPALILEAAHDPEQQARGRACLARMGKERVFGVPLFVAAGQRFFGNDRLELLRQHLDRA